MAAERAWMAAVAAVAVCSAAMAVAWSAHGGYGYGGHAGVDGVGTAALGGGESPLPLPADTPDARDDDVVARQLREAAMAETDPELREKLWQEYERYKAGL